MSNLNNLMISWRGWENILCIAMMRNVMMSTAHFVHINNVTEVNDTDFLCWVSTKTSKINYILKQGEIIVTASFPLLCPFAWPQLPQSSNTARTFLLNFPYSQDFELQNGTNSTVCLLRKKNNKERKRTKKNKKEEKEERENQQGGEREQHLVRQEDNHYWPMTMHLPLSL